MLIILNRQRAGVTLIWETPILDFIVCFASGLGCALLCFSLLWIYAVAVAVVALVSRDFSFTWQSWVFLWSCISSLLSFCLFFRFFPNFQAAVVTCQLSRAAVFILEALGLYFPISGLYVCMLMGWKEVSRIDWGKCVGGDGTVFLQFCFAAKLQQKKESCPIWCWAIRFCWHFASFVAIFQTHFPNQSNNH